MNERTYDIVLFGATGYTGALVAQYLARVSEHTPLRWALAGRNGGKLASVRDGLALPAGPRVPALVQADVGDEASIRNMAKDARVVITTVGPYARYGEPLVRACAELGTHYVDLTGEPGFVRQMSERYHVSAESTHAKIVNACGFDSIPHDLGAYYTLQRLREKLSPEQREHTPITIEGFVRGGGGFSGGTWHSAIDAMSKFFEERSARKHLEHTHNFDDRKARVLPLRASYRAELDLWALPLPSIDPDVVVRSARVLTEYGTDFRYGHYMGVRKLSTAAAMATGVGAMFTLAQVPPARALLQKVKDPGEGPSEAQRAKGWFRVIFRGSGAGQHVACEVCGGDPGYGETAKMLAESALCLAFDAAALPPHCGVVTTAAAMGNVLIERLQKAGISFRQTA